MKLTMRCVLVCFITLQTVISQATDSATAAVGTPRRGGEAVVLLTPDFGGSWSAGLDPATNYNGGANLSLMNSIYGGLFQLIADPDGRNPRVIGVLASGYDITEDGRTVVIHLRKGAVFSDGTPFNAEAVKFSIERNLSSDCSCSRANWPWRSQRRVEAVGDDTVVLHFTQPFAAVINGLPSSSINWTVSPTALRRMGPEQFKLTPVGAGPFRVVSDQLSSKLVLERNPRYWQKGRPYLDRLIFQVVGSEQAAYQALLSGDAQGFEGMDSIPLTVRSRADARLRVTMEPATSPMVVQLNTKIAPFNDQQAREAIYYATNVDAIRKGLYKGWYSASQSFTADGGLFHHPTIPGYRTYDPAKARAIVRQLGGLSVTLGTLRKTSTEQVITALQSQWQQAGITVKIESYDLGTLIKRFDSGDWQAMLQTAGAYDPEIGIGLGFRFRSNSRYSGVHDPQLDRLMDAATATLDTVKRDQLYFDIGKYISDKAYAPFLVATGTANLTRGLYGTGLTTAIPPLLLNAGVLWQDVWLAGR